MGSERQEWCCAACGETFFKPARTPDERGYCSLCSVEDQAARDRDELASLRARLEAAERKAREWQSAAHAAGDRATAAERELEYLKEVSAKRDADVLTALDYKGTDSTPLHAAHVRLSELLEAKRQHDAANALLRDICDARYKDELQDEISRADAHLAASPSPLASPEGDGAGRECVIRDLAAALQELAHAETLPCVWATASTALRRHGLHVPSASKHARECDRHDAADTTPCDRCGWPDGDGVALEQTVEELEDEVDECETALMYANLEQGEREQREAHDHLDAAKKRLSDARRAQGGDSNAEGSGA